MRNASTGPAQRPVRRSRKWAAATLAAVLTFGVSLVAAPASAAPSKYTTVAGSRYGSGVGYWMGSFKATAGTAAERAEVAFCALDLDERAPDQANVTFGGKQYASTWVARGDGSVTKSVNSTTTARIAYILSRWGESTSAARARAIYWISHEKALVPRGGHNLSASDKALGNEMWADAVKYAGPYNDYVKVTTKATKPVANKTFQIDYGTKSAAGNEVGGHEQVLTITGPARWSDSTGTVTGNGKILTIDSNYSGRSRSVIATGAGEITISMKSAVAEDRIVWRSPADSAFQRIMVAGQTRSLSASTKFDVAPDWDYKINTVAAATSAAPITYATASNPVRVGVGALTQDYIDAQVTSGTWPSGAEITVNSTLYGPLNSLPALSSTVPAGTKSAGTVTTKLTGTAKKYTPAIRLNTPGYYVWHETAPATTHTSAWRAQYGVRAETVWVPWQPTVTTQSSAPQAMRTQQVRDGITVNGHRPGQAITATARLYYHGETRPTRQAAVPGSARLMTTFSVPMTTNSSGTASAYTPWWTIPASADSGYYTWVVSLPAIANVSLAYTSDYGIQNETFVVSDASLFVTTETSDAIAEPGAMLRDNIRISTTSDLALYPAVITSRLWGPFDTEPVQSVSVPSGAPMVGQVVHTRTNIAPYNTDPIALPNRSGFYAWTAHAAGTTDYDAYDSEFAEATEVTVVPWEPKVTTQVSTARALAGDEVTDELSLTDGRPGVPLDVHSTLYGPLPAVPDVTAGPPAGAPVVGTVVTTLTPGADGTATGTTEPLTLPESGVYVWHETIAADTGGTWKEWVAPFGVTSETVVVPWQPKVETEASHEVTDLTAADLYDNLIIDGLQPLGTVDVESTLYGPLAEEPVLGADVPAGTPIAGTVTTSVTADEFGHAEAATAPITVTVAGYYVWRETIADGTLNDEWAGMYGIEAETTLVRWQPAVVTQTSTAVASAGAYITDTLTVSGGRPGVPLTAVSTLYGPFDAAPTLQATVPADAPIADTVATVVIPDASGSATVETEEVMLPSSGYYVWHETIAASPDGTVIAWSAPFGVASETTLAQWTPQIATKASHALAEPGAGLSDTLTVTGWSPDAAPTTATSTLYGPFEDAPVLSADVPSNAPIVGVVHTEISGDGEYVTEALTVDAPGYYVWHEVMAATAATEEWTAQFGVSAETTFIPAPQEEPEAPEGGDGDDDGRDGGDNDGDDDGRDGGDNDGDDDLAVTGANGIGGLVGGASLLLMAGSLLILMRRRLRVRSINTL